MRRLLYQIAHREKIVTISTLITLTRVVLIPFIIIAILSCQWKTALIIFITASATDMIDGGLARYLNERTFVGACLDPIADKLLVLSCFFTFAFVQSTLFTIPHWFFWLVFIKEVVLVGGFLIIYSIRGHTDVQPCLLGKISTVVQMGFIMWLMICSHFNYVPTDSIRIILAASLALVFASLIQYGLRGLRWLYGIRRTSCE